MAKEGDQGKGTELEEKNEPRRMKRSMKPASVVGDPDCGSLLPLKASSLLRGSTGVDPLHDRARPSRATRQRRLQPMAMFQVNRETTRKNAKSEMQEETHALAVRTFFIMPAWRARLRSSSTGYGFLLLECSMRKGDGGPGVVSVRWASRWSREHPVTAPQQAAGFERQQAAAVRVSDHRCGLVPFLLPPCDLRASSAPPRFDPPLPRCLSTDH